MSFHVVEGYTEIVSSDVMNCAIGNVEVISQSDGGEEAGVMHPFVHPLDEAFVVAIENEARERVVVWVLLLKVSVDDGGGMNGVEEAVGFGAKGLEGRELARNDSTSGSNQSARGGAYAVGE